MIYINKEKPELTWNLDKTNKVIIVEEIENDVIIIENMLKYITKETFDSFLERIKHDY